MTEHVHISAQAAEGSVVLEEVALSGVGRDVIRTWPLKLLATVTGILVLKWMILLCARYLLGLRTECRLSFNGRRVRIQTETRCFGRPVRSSDEFILARELLSIRVEKRYPYLLSLAGMAGVFAGAWYGLNGFIDGIQANYASIAVAGLGILVAGVVLDIIFGSLADSLGSRESLALTFRDKSGLFARKGIRVAAIPEAQAQSFTEKFVALAP